VGNVSKRDREHSEPGGNDSASGRNHSPPAANDSEPGANVLYPEGNVAALRGDEHGGELLDPRHHHRDVVGLRRTHDSGAVNLGELFEKMPSSLITAFLDELKSNPGVLQVARFGFLEKRPQIVEILWPLAVIARQDLQSHKVADAGYRHVEARKDVQLFSGLGDLRLDSRGCKQQIDESSTFCFARGAESHRRQAASRLLFEDGENCVAERLQTEDERLGLLVIGHRDHEIDIPCRSGLSPGPNRQAADESPGPSEFPEVVDDPAKSFFERIHGRRGQET
jgi:hypothetical protein